MVTAGSRAVIAESLQVVACFAFLAYYKPNEFGRITASVFGFSTLALILIRKLTFSRKALYFLV